MVELIVTEVVEVTVVIVTTCREGIYTGRSTNVVSFLMQTQDNMVQVCAMPTISAVCSGIIVLRPFPMHGYESSSALNYMCLAALTTSSAIL